MQVLLQLQLVVAISRSNRARAKTAAMSSSSSSSRAKAVQLLLVVMWALGLAKLGPMQPTVLSQLVVLGGVLWEVLLVEVGAQVGTWRAVAAPVGQKQPDV
jgi:hypothetical protein